MYNSQTSRLPEAYHLQSIDTYALNDGSSCSIAPGWGCNLFSWVVDGQELIYCPPGLPETAEKITGGGSPLLFPAVGRTWDHSSGAPVQGVYRIHGSDRTYFMPSHGILFLSRFDKVDEQVSGGRAMAAYELTVPAEAHEQDYPFDMGLRMTFTLTPGRIAIDADISNRGSVPAPAAFGHHPYFAISNSRREGVEARLAARRRLFVTPDTVLFTGESEGFDGVIQLEPDVYYDHVFGDPAGKRMSLVDRCAGRVVSVEYDDSFELFLVYSPNGSDFVCIEPWTRGLGAFEHLRDPGWESGDLIPVYAPGESRRIHTEYAVSFEDGR